MLDKILPIYSENVISAREFQEKDAREYVIDHTQHELFNEMRERVESRTETIYKWCMYWYENKELSHGPQGFRMNLRGDLYVAPKEMEEYLPIALPGDIIHLVDGSKGILVDIRSYKLEDGVVCYQYDVYNDNPIRYKYPHVTVEEESIVSIEYHNGDIPKINMVNGNNTTYLG